MKAKNFRVIGFLVLLGAFAGCSFVVQPGRRSDVEKIKKLSEKVDELTEAQRLLEERLAREIGDNEVQLSRQEKGLVITFVADILFDSGKAKLKPEAYASMDKVARVLNENVADFKVGVEGHTDNQPIKFSPWKSNWRLSSERALSVLEYLVDEKQVAPERLSALAYGEYQAVADNSTAEGRKLNRRVEIVIFPKIAKVKQQEEDREEEENLK